MTDVVCETQIRAEDTASLTYYEANKERIKERYRNNSEALKAYQTEYNLNNHERYVEYQKNYYEQRKEKILQAKKEKVTCECGKVVTIGHMSTHKKTNIHLKRLSKLQTESS
jgi:phosphohistidine phosphatase SixA